MKEIKDQSMNDEKKKPSQVTIKFSDGVHYEDVMEYLNENEEANGVLIAKAVNAYKKNLEANEVIDALPETLTNVFSGGGDTIDMALTTIKNTFITLAATTATAVDERENTLRKHYVKQVESLEKNLDTMKDKDESNSDEIERLNNQVSVCQAEQDKFESEAKAALEKVESLESTLKDKEALIMSLEESKKQLMENSTSKDLELSELRVENKVLLENTNVLSKNTTELDVALKLKEQELNNHKQEVIRLQAVESRLSEKLNDMEMEHKSELKLYKEESKQELAQIKNEHKNEIRQVKQELIQKNERLESDNDALKDEVRIYQSKLNELYEQLMSNSKTK